MVFLSVMGSKGYKYTQDSTTYSVLCFNVEFSLLLSDVAVKVVGEYNSLCSKWAKGKLCFS